MRARTSMLSAGIAAILLLSQATAQDHVRWQSDLEAAKRLAAQSNRHILIHFWAPWCDPCMHLEQTVFNQPGFGASLEANFVPVRVNVDEHPHLARQYGVQAIPADAITTAQGVPIQTISSPMTGDQYLARVNGISTGARQAAATAQGSSGVATAQPAAAGQPAQSGPPRTAPPVGDRYADYYNNRYGQPQAQQPRPDQQPQGQQPQGQQPQGQQPQGQQPQGQQPQGQQPAYAHQPQGSPQHQPPGPTAGQPAGPQGNHANSDSPHSHTAQAGAMFPPQTPQWNQPTADQPLPPRVGSVPPSGHAMANHAPWGATAPQQHPQQPPRQQANSPAAAEPQPNHPPIGLDGFCPVQLVESQRWVLGDRRWGAIHMGRTYLFAGPEEQKKFLARPDRYSPVAAGHDPVLALEGQQMVPGRREHGVFYDGRIFLFSSEESLERFSQSPSRYAPQIYQAMRQ